MNYSVTNVIMKKGDIVWLWNYKQQQPVPVLVISKSSHDSKSNMFESPWIFSILYHNTLLELPMRMLYPTKELCEKDFFKSVIF